MGKTGAQVLFLGKHELELLSIGGAFNSGRKIYTVRLFDGCFEVSHLMALVVRTRVQ